ncbi:flagellar biosynthetic protein FliO [Massilia sp. CF038]|uniref:flagellar biosynthetic protein FliO n=1 Tax=Massilia sp. CF038 TaxID=1881045 RepID=UPI000911913F|nr:flagellar biosynthetic protein FliO [Massilia sp. CF038]SHG44571.1 flagellar protein FliO/FliZ [Massilia sp. CF038]
MTRGRLRAILLGALLASAQAGAVEPAVPSSTVPPAPAAPSAVASVPATTTAPAATNATLPARPALQTAPALPQPAQPPVATSAGNLVQTITGLLLVLGALALFAWGMKRFGPKAQAGAGGLRIVGGLNLGGRERIVLVEVGDQWIVVGASPGRVNALATMPRQETVPAPLSGDTQVPASSFAAWLKQTIDQRNAK